MSNYIAKTIEVITSRAKRDDNFRKEVYYSQTFKHLVRIISEERLDLEWRECEHCAQKIIKRAYLVRYGEEI